MRIKLQYRRLHYLPNLQWIDPSRHMLMFINMPNDVIYGRQWHQESPFLTGNILKDVLEHRNRVHEELFIHKVALY